jgi:hypothetical protein
MAMGKRKRRAKQASMWVATQDLTRGITAISRSSISKPSASAATSRNPIGADGTGSHKPEARAAVYRNRRRLRGARGLRLLRLRGERLERPFAHLYETGGMRRVYLRGHPNILKRLLIHTGGFNLGLLMRQLIGVGTPRGLQGRLSAVVAVFLALIRSLLPLVTGHGRLVPYVSRLTRRPITRSAALHVGVREPVFTTGC